MNTPTYELFFTGRDDPRDGCIVIGEDTRPIFFEFETIVTDYMTSTQTTIYSDKRPVGYFEWSTGGNHLGFATIGNRSFPMFDLVMPGTTQSARRFTTPDGRTFEWQSFQDDPQSYELLQVYAPYNSRIAVFRRYPQETPLGLSHGYLQYTLTHDIPLLEALMALSINRWMDWGRRSP